MTYRLIGISGSSSSGKSTLANGLKTHFGDMCEIISMDDFHKQLPDYVELADGTKNYDHPDNLVWADFIEAIRKLKNGEIAQIPVYVKGWGENTGRVGYREVDPTNKIVVIEGYFLYHHPEVLDLLEHDNRYFLRLEEPVIRHRRNMAYANIEGFSDDGYFDHLMAAFREFIEPTKEHCPTENVIDASGTIDEVFIEFMSKAKLEAEV